MRLSLRFFSSAAIGHVLLRESNAAHSDSLEHDCAAKKPTKDDEVRSILNEIVMYGKPGKDMTPAEMKDKFTKLKSSTKEKESDPKLLRRNRRLAMYSGSGYTLRGMPIVYHILANQDDGSAGSPSATVPQLRYMTDMTNRLFNVYDRSSGEEVQWATFVEDVNSPVVHTDRYDKDCNDLTESEMEGIVTTHDDGSPVPGWEVKFHVIVCESTAWSGVASLPHDYKIHSHMHNLVRIDYRAIACRDDDGSFLCDRTPGGEEVSHTRWWRTRSTVLAHELGHLFGLYHTFQGGCADGGDLVSDTPHETSSDTDGCPGLLPYDRDRDPFDAGGGERAANAAGVGESCAAGTADGPNSDPCAGGTCAACCLGSNCELYRGIESVSEDEAGNPSCCSEDAPDDSCPARPGIDPKNNVMAYVPDFCGYELTPGQMFRMMAQVRAEKDWIYCNYASALDEDKCSSKKVPCAETATSPNCRSEPGVTGGTEAPSDSFAATLTGDQVTTSQVTTSVGTQAPTDKKATTASVTTEATDHATTTTKKTKAASTETKDPLAERCVSDDDCKSKDPCSPRTCSSSPRTCVDGESPCAATEVCVESDPPCKTCESCDHRVEACEATDGCRFEPIPLECASEGCGSCHNKELCRLDGCTWNKDDVCEGTPLTIGVCYGTAADLSHVCVSLT